MMGTYAGDNGNNTFKDLDSDWDQYFGYGGNDAFWFYEKADGYGGTGDDTYYLMSLSNIMGVFEYEGQGNDTIRLMAEPTDGATYEYTIPNYVEVLNNWMEGSYYLTINGNKEDNFIYSDDQYVESWDTIYGGDGNDTIFSYEKGDTLYGDNGNDTLNGGHGSDTLYGGDGQDVLIPGEIQDGDVDNLWGGADRDFFFMSQIDTKLSDTTYSEEHFGAYFASYVAPSLLLSAVATPFGFSGWAGYAASFANSAISTAVNYSAVVAYQLNNRSIIQGEDPDDVTLIMDFDPREDVVVIQVTPGLSITPSYDESGGILTIFGDTGVLAKIRLSEEVKDLLDLQGFTATGLLQDVMEHTRGDYNGATLTSQMFANWGLSTVQSATFGDQYDSDTNLLLIGAWAAMQTKPDTNHITWGTNQDDVLRAETASFYTNYDTYGSTTGTSTQGSILYGWAGNDWLAGTNFGDKLYGGDGNDGLWGYNNSYDANNLDANIDYLYGGAGDDVLNGGDGVDYMEGGIGNDTYHLTQTNGVNDTVVENANEGTDTIVASFTINLNNYANFENATLSGTGNINATGNSSNNTLTGNSGNNTLDGGSGNDALVGGSGNDQYYVDSTSDTVTEGSSTGGTDIVYASVNWTLGNNVENLTLTGTSAIYAYGNSGNNTITGNSSANSLYGYGGIDVLDGKSGNDAMYGGTGNDIYYVDSTSDTVTESSSTGGTDTVYASVSWTLGNYVENLTLSGTSAINGYGNSLNNTITGNSAANSLYGYGGNDTFYGGSSNDAMDGGEGNDEYYVDSTNDTVTESSSTAGGTDTVYSSVTWTLGNYVENLTLYGSSSIDGYGNDLSNTITGNTGNNILSGYGNNDAMYGGSGNDTLNGGLGNDAMYGGTGNDIYYVDSTSDTITESSLSYGGTDIVYSSVDWTLGNYIENLTLSGTAINGTGNGLNNKIIGNSSANSLNGSGGNDILDGGTGNDTLTGGTGTDVFYFFSGKDTITDFAAGEKIYVQLAGIDQASEVTVNGDVYTFAGFDSAYYSLTVTGVDPTSIYYDSSASALVMAA